MTDHDEQILRDRMKSLYIENTRLVTRVSDLETTAPVTAGTRLGLWLFFLYPPLILAFDGVLKFVLRDSTISALVWSSPRLRWAACVHMTIWAVALILHFGFKLLGGGRHLFGLTATWEPSPQAIRRLRAFAVLLSMFIAIGIFYIAYTILTALGGQWQAPK